MNQVAVVIGGGQTLGAFLCHGLAAEGYRVAVVDIQSDKAANVAQEINAEYSESMAYGFGADATSEQSVLALSRGVDEIFGRVDLLVYSAGIAKAAFISDFQLGDFDRSLQVNLVGYFLCAREFSRLMIRDGIQGRIIQINSKSGKVGSKHNSGYSAAKFGGVGLTRSLALDLAEYGITVHSLMLGNLLKSPMFQSLLPQYATKLGIKPDQVEQYYIDQNHGYAVDSDTVKLGKVRFANANDGTCEGIDYPELKAFTVQFHPEACTGPKDTTFLFDRFVELMKGGRV